MDWGIEEPKEKPIYKVREIRNEIEGKIKEMAEVIGRENKNS